MHPFLGYFILSLVVLGVLSFCHMVAGIGGIGGASRMPNKYKTLIAIIAIGYAIIVTFVGGGIALGACAAAAVVVFLFWVVRR